MKLKSLVSCSFDRLRRCRAPAHAQVEIQWWHSMGGALGEWVNDLAKGFNESQKDYKVVPVFKGSYRRVDDRGASPRSAPATRRDILQVFEVGTATMMASKGAIVPVGKVMKDAGEKFDPSAYMPAVAGYYTAPNGQMLSFPFNSSTTIFYYQQGRVQGGRPRPRTSRRPPGPRWRSPPPSSRPAASKCPFTTSWQSAGRSSRASRAWHNVAVRDQGQRLRRHRRAPRRSTRRCTCATSQNLANMAKQGLFVYKGRNNERRRHVPVGRVRHDHRRRRAATATIKKNAKFDFGVAPLPYYPDVAGAPQNTVIGGASLWVMAGKKPDEYKGVAEVLQLPVAAPRCSRRATSAPATCRSRRRRTS